MFLDVNILQTVNKIFEVDNFTDKFDALYTTLCLDNNGAHE